MEADQQKCNLSEHKGETAAAAAGGCFFFFLLRWSTGADAALAFHPTFPQGRCSVCVGQQKEGGGRTEKKVPGWTERDSLPSAQMWPSDWWPRVASSLSQWPHTQGELVTGRSADCENGHNRMGGRAGWAFPPSRLTFTSSVAPNVFVCLSAGGWKPGPWAWTDYLYGQQTQGSENFACFCLFPLAPEILEKIVFRLNLRRAFA